MIQWLSLHNSCLWRSLTLCQKCQSLDQNKKENSQKILSGCSLRWRKCRYCLYTLCNINGFTSLIFLRRFCKKWVIRKKRTFHLTWNLLIGKFYWMVFATEFSDFFCAKTTFRQTLALSNYFLRIKTNISMTSTSHRNRIKISFSKTTQSASHLF